MNFNSVDFALFFPIVVIVYYILPKKIRYIWLLMASYYFYINWNAMYILLLFSCTLITYLGGNIIEHLKNLPNSHRKQKICLITCVTINLLVLCFYKYFDFLLLNVNRLLQMLHLPSLNWNFDIILPVGISFYMLQALGYLIDVYRDDIYAEKNFLRYALFVSFFPQLVAGPIERSKNLLRQLYEPKTFSYDNLRKGILIMLYGFFLKIVIADRIAIFVNTVFDSPEYYQGFYIIVAVLLFAVQIYCDFYGYSTIAKGAALVMGIHLMENFSAPFFSKSIKEFWRRWHISLSGWFRDYLYIPLGGSKNGTWRKWINLLIIFGISGLWHGASYAFIIWGLLNGLYQIIGEILEPIRKKISIFFARPYIFSMYNILEIVNTFLLTSFAFLFFRAGEIGDAVKLVNNIFVNNISVLLDGSLFNLGISRESFIVLLLAMVILFIIDGLKYKQIAVVDRFFSLPIGIRFIGELFLLYSILLFGCYGIGYSAQDFIYFQF